MVLSQRNVRKEEKGVVGGEDPARTGMVLF
jgi:hypothetical protein